MTRPFLPKAKTKPRWPLADCERPDEGISGLLKRPPYAIGKRPLDSEEESGNVVRMREWVYKKVNMLRHVYKGNEADPLLLAGTYDGLRQESLPSVGRKQRQFVIT